MHTTLCIQHNMHMHTSIQHMHTTYAYNMRCIQPAYTLHTTQHAYILAYNTHTTLHVYNMSTTCLQRGFMGSCHQKFRSNQKFRLCPEPPFCIFRTLPGSNLKQRSKKGPWVMNLVNYGVGGDLYLHERTQNQKTKMFGKGSEDLEYNMAVLSMRVPGPKRAVGICQLSEVVSLLS